MNTSQKELRGPLAPNLTDVKECIIHGAYDGCCSVKYHPKDNMYCGECTRFGVVGIAPTVEGVRMAMKITVRNFSNEKK